MQMDYFRRPRLSGNNITRTTRATIRGSLRRTDADGSSTVPYFPTAVAGQDIWVSVDGAVPATVTLTDTNVAGTGIVTAIADLNTALNPGAEAFDTDGTISIRSALGTGLGSIEVVGGSASAALGFDTTLGRIRATYGEVFSSTEARIGNFFGTAFPSKNETLSAESVNRAFARLTSNADVLYSEHMRADALPKKIAFTTPDNIVLTPTLPDETRIFTGLGTLNNSTSKEVLSRFFYLVDQATGLPPASRVVAVTRGTPVFGFPLPDFLPFSNATTWTGGGATGNILGVSLAKSTFAITSISQGRVIKCAGASFQFTSKVVPGDYVEISGATNITPWSNNGNRWVVEEVITEETLSVRPMSSSELAQFGPVTTEEHPILELNAKKTGGEIYGTAIVRNGTFCNDVNIFVDPPIPTGCTYDLYASTPGDLRSKKTHEAQASQTLNSFSATDLRPEPNAILVAPHATAPTLLSFTLTSGYGRFSGRVVSIPGRTVYATEFAVGVNYLYWDKDTNQVKITQSPVKVFNSDPTLSPGSAFPADTQASHWLIATVTKAGLNIANLEPASRQLAEEGDAHVVTIGLNGQFTNLTEAVEFINRWSSQNGGRTNTYHQYEIVFLNDYEVVEPVTFNCSVKLRGARPDVKVHFNCGSTAFNFGNGTLGTFIVEDLFFTFDASYAAIPSGILSGAANSTVVLKNLETATTASFFGLGGFVGKTLIIDSCRIYGIKNVIDTAAATTTIEIFNSKFGMLASVGVDAVLFGLDATPLVYQRITVRDCDFSGLNTTAVYSDSALMGTFTSTAIFDGCTFSKSAPNPPVSNSVLFKQGVPTGHLIISNCTARAPTRCFIDVSTDTNFCIIENCTIDVEPDGIDPGIRAPVVRSCSIFGSGGSGQVLIEATRECHGNFLTGDADIGIVNGLLNYPYVNISNNRIALDRGTSIRVASYNISPPNYDMMVNVVDNQILVGFDGVVGIQTYDTGASANLTNGSIRGNLVQLDIGTAGSNNKIGIDVKGTPTVEGNTVSLFNTGTTTGHVGINIHKETAPATSGISLPKVIGNSVTFDSNAFDALAIRDGAPCIVIGNHLLTPGAALAWRGTVVGSISCYVQNNYLDGSIVSLAATYFNGNVALGNVATTSPVGLVTSIADNYFSGSSVIIYGQASRWTRVERNTFNDEPSFFGGFVDLHENIFQVGMYYQASGMVSKNHFHGVTPIALEGTGDGALVVDGNSFAGANSNHIWGFPAVVCRNQFLGSASFQIGDMTQATVGTQFHDNYCTGPMDIQSSSTNYTDVSRNFFNSDVFFYEVDRLDNNYFVDGDLNISGRVAGLGSPGPVSASGNTIIGDGQRIFIRLAFSGLSYHSSSGTTYISDCSVSSSQIDVSSQTLFEFYNSRVSSTLISISGSLTLWGNNQMDGVTFGGAVSLTFADGSSNTFNNLSAPSNVLLQSDGANSAVVDLTVSNSTISAHLSATLVDGGNITFANNVVNRMTAALGQNSGGGTVIANGNRVRTQAASFTCNYAEIVGNDFGSTVEVLDSAGVPSDGMHTTFSENRVVGDASLTHAYTTVVGNHFEADFAYSPTLGNYYFNFESNIIDGDVFTVAAAQVANINNNTFIASSITTFEVSANTLYFTNNTIAPSSACLVNFKESIFRAHIEGNRIYGHVKICSIGVFDTVGYLHFCRNEIYNVSANEAVRIGTIGKGSTNGGALISENIIIQDLSALINNFYNAIGWGVCDDSPGYSTNPSRTITFTKNVIQVNNPTFSSPTTQTAYLIFGGAGGSSDIILDGNQLYRPVNLTVPARNWEFLHIGGSPTQTLYNGNLMYGNTTANTVTTGAGRGGENLYQAAPGAIWSIV